MDTSQANVLQAVALVVAIVTGLTAGIYTFIRIQRNEKWKAVAAFLAAVTITALASLGILRLAGQPLTSDHTPTPTATSMAATETAAREAHTWTDYTNAGGAEGPIVAAHQTVQVACRLTGFKVANGNAWWYRIAQSPWNNQYYVSADAFYNNGQTSGSLVGTPFVDLNVPIC